jgi:1-acyl-sn-glycerol-3-phosphate acyltransferase
MKRAASIALSLLIWCSGWIWFFFAALFLLLIGLFRAGAFFESWLKGLCRSLVWICGVHVTVSGREYFQAGHQYLLMMNHVNILDAFVFYGSFPGKARGIEEESHFGWPVYGWVIRRMGQVPVNRRSGVRAMESLRRAAKLIREKTDFSFMVLPEGTRTRDGKLGPFKKGGFLLALETGLDILPLVQKGLLPLPAIPGRILRS